MSTIKMIYNCEYNEADYLEYFLEDAGITEEEYKEFERVYEDDFIRFCDEAKINEYHDEIVNVMSYENTHGRKKYVVKATLGLWYGNCEGGKVIEGMDTVISDCIGGCEFFKFFMEGRVMRFVTSHHDGVNHFWIKELTERGERYYEIHKNDMSDREMIEKLYSDRHLSKHVTIWHNVYGM